MITAAHIILARPNSVEEMPAIWPMGKISKGQHCVDFQGERRTQDVEPSDQPTDLGKERTASGSGIYIGQNSR